MKWLIVPAASVLALASCGRQPDGKGQADKPKPGAPQAAAPKAAENEDHLPLSTSAEAPYYVKLPLSEFMPHVMQYAGDGIWKWQGWISNKTGMHSLFPKNDQEWEQAESGARTLAEVTNVLLLPGRRLDDPEWDKAVLSVRSVALIAAAAAEKHDKDAFFAAGGQLDEACDECHIRFDPSFKKKT